MAIRQRDHLHTCDIKVPVASMFDFVQELRHPEVLHPDGATYEHIIQRFHAMKYTELCPIDDSFVATLIGHAFNPERQPLTPDWLGLRESLARTFFEKQGVISRLLEIWPTAAQDILYSCASSGQSACGELALNNAAVFSAKLRETKGPNWVVTATDTENLILELLSLINTGAAYNSPQVNTFILNYLEPIINKAYKDKQAPAHVCMNHVVEHLLCDLHAEVCSAAFANKLQSLIEAGDFQGLDAWYAFFFQQSTIHLQAKTFYLKAVIGALHTAERIEALPPHMAQDVIATLNLPDDMQQPDIKILVGYCDIKAIDKVTRNTIIQGLSRDAMGVKRFVTELFSLSNRGAYALDWLLQCKPSDKSNQEWLNSLFKSYILREGASAFLAKITPALSWPTLMPIVSFLRGCPESELGVPAGFKYTAYEKIESSTLEQIISHDAIVLSGDVVDAFETNLFGRTNFSTKLLPLLLESFVRQNNPSNFERLYGRQVSYEQRRMLFGQISTQLRQAPSLSARLMSPRLIELMKLSVESKDYINNVSLQEDILSLFKHCESSILKALQETNARDIAPMLDAAFNPSIIQEATQVPKTLGECLAKEGIKRGCFDVLSWFTLAQASKYFANSPNLFTVLNMLSGPSAKNKKKIAPEGLAGLIHLAAQRGPADSVVQMCLEWQLFHVSKRGEDNTLSMAMEAGLLGTEDLMALVKLCQGTINHPALFADDFITPDAFIGMVGDKTCQHDWLTDYVKVLSQLTAEYRLAVAQRLVAEAAIRASWDEDELNDELLWEVCADALDLSGPLDAIFIKSLAHYLVLRQHRSEDSLSDAWRSVMTYEKLRPFVAEKEACFKPLPYRLEIPTQENLVLSSLKRTPAPAFPLVEIAPDATEVTYRESKEDYHQCTDEAFVFTSLTKENVTRMNTFLNQKCLVGTTFCGMELDTLPHQRMTCVTDKASNAVTLTHFEGKYQLKLSDAATLYQRTLSKEWVTSTETTYTRKLKQGVFQAITDAGPSEIKKYIYTDENKELCIQMVDENTGYALLTETIGRQVRIVRFGRAIDTSAFPKAPFLDGLQFPDRLQFKPDLDKKSPSTTVICAVFNEQGQQTEQFEYTPWHQFNLMNNASVLLTDVMGDMSGNIETIQQALRLESMRHLSDVFDRLVCTATIYEQVTPGQPAQQARIMTETSCILATAEEVLRTPKREVKQYIYGEDTQAPLQSIQVFVGTGFNGSAVLRAIPQAIPDEGARIVTTVIPQRDTTLRLIQQIFPGDKLHKYSVLNQAEQLLARWFCEDKEASVPEQLQVFYYDKTHEGRDYLTRAVTVVPLKVNDVAIKEPVAVCQALLARRADIVASSQEACTHDDYSLSLDDTGHVVLTHAFKGGFCSELEVADEQTESFVINDSQKVVRYTDTEGLEYEVLSGEDCDWMKATTPNRVHYQYAEKTQVVILSPEAHNRVIFLPIGFHPSLEDFIHPEQFVRMTGFAHQAETLREPRLPDDRKVHSQERPTETRDGFGRVRSFVNANYKTIQVDYDERYRGRITQMGLIHYDYYDNGLLKKSSVKDDSVHTLYTYNKRHQLTGTEERISDAHTIMTGLVYDTQGRVTEYHDANDGKAYYYFYNQDNQPLVIVSKSPAELSSQSSYIIEWMTYDEQQRMTQVKTAQFLSEEDLTVDALLIRINNCNEHYARMIDYSQRQIVTTVDYVKPLDGAIKGIAKVSTVTFEPYTLTIAAANTAEDVAAWFLAFKNAQDVQALQLCFNRDALTWTLFGCFANEFKQYDDAVLRKRMPVDYPLYLMNETWAEVMPHTQEIQDAVVRQFNLYAQARVNKIDNKYVRCEKPADCVKAESMSAEEILSLKLTPLETVAYRYEPQLLKANVCQLVLSEVDVSGKYAEEQADHTVVVKSIGKAYRLTNMQDSFSKEIDFSTHGKHYLLKSTESHAALEHRRVDHVECKSLLVGECGLIRMMVDPNVEEEEALGEQLKHKPAYVLWENKIYYFYEEGNYKSTASWPSNSTWEALFPPSANGYKDLTLEDAMSIRRLIGNDSHLETLVTLTYDYSNPLAITQNWQFNKKLLAGYQRDAKAGYEIAGGALLFLVGACLVEFGIGVPMMVGGAGMMASAIAADKLAALSFYVSEDGVAKTTHGLDAEGYVSWLTVHRRPDADDDRTEIYYRNTYHQLVRLESTDKQQTAAGMETKAETQRYWNVAGQAVLEHMPSQIAIVDDSINYLQPESEGFQAGNVLQEMNRLSGLLDHEDECNTSAEWTPHLSGWHHESALQRLNVPPELALTVIDTFVAPLVLGVITVSTFFVATPEFIAEKALANVAEEGVALTLAKAGGKWALSGTKGALLGATINYHNQMYRLSRTLQDEVSLDEIFKSALGFAIADMGGFAFDLGIEGFQMTALAERWKALIELRGAKGIALGVGAKSVMLTRSLLVPALFQASDICFYGSHWDWTAFGTGVALDWGTRLNKQFGLGHATRELHPALRTAQAAFAHIMLSILVDLLVEDNVSWSSVDTTWLAFTIVGQGHEAFHDKTTKRYHDILYALVREHVGQRDYTKIIDAIEHNPDVIHTDDVMKMIENSVPLNAVHAAKTDFILAVREKALNGEYPRVFQEIVHSNTNDYLSLCDSPEIHQRMVDELADLKKRPVVLKILTCLLVRHGDLRWVSDGDRGAGVWGAPHSDLNYLKILDAVVDEQIAKKHKSPDADLMLRALLPFQARLAPVMAEVDALQARKQALIRKLMGQLPFTTGTKKRVTLKFIHSQQRYVIEEVLGHQQPEQQYQDIRMLLKDEDPKIQAEWFVALQPRLSESQLTHWVNREDISVDAWREIFTKLPDAQKVKVSEAHLQYCRERAFDCYVRQIHWFLGEYAKWPEATQRALLNIEAPERFVAQLLPLLNQDIAGNASCDEQRELLMGLITPVMHRIYLRDPKGYLAVMNAALDSRVWKIAKALLPALSIDYMHSTLSKVESDDKAYLDIRSEFARVSGEADRVLNWDFQDPQKDLVVYLMDESPVLKVSPAVVALALVVVHLKVRSLSNHRDPRYYQTLQDNLREKISALSDAHRQACNAHYLYLLSTLPERSQISEEYQRARSLVPEIDANAIEGASILVPENPEFVLKTSYYFTRTLGGLSNIGHEWEWEALKYIDLPSNGDGERLDHYLRLLVGSPEGFSQPKYTARRRVVSSLLIMKQYIPNFIVDNEISSMPASVSSVLFIQTYTIYEKYALKLERIRAFGDALLLLDKHGLIKAHNIESILHLLSEHDGCFARAAHDIWKKAIADKTLKTEVDLEKYIGYAANQLRVQPLTPNRNTIYAKSLRDQFAVAGFEPNRIQDCIDALTETAERDWQAKNSSGIRDVACEHELAFLANVVSPLHAHPRAHLNCSVLEFFEALEGKDSTGRVPDDWRHTRHLLLNLLIKSEIAAGQRTVSNSIDIILMLTLLQQLTPDESKRFIEAVDVYGTYFMKQSRNPTRDFIDRVDSRDYLKKQQEIIKLFTRVMQGTETPRKLKILKKFVSVKGLSGMQETQNAEGMNDEQGDLSREFCYRWSHFETILNAPPVIDSILDIDLQLAVSFACGIAVPTTVNSDWAQVVMHHFQNVTPEEQRSLAKCMAHSGPAAYFYIRLLDTLYTKELHSDPVSFTSRLITEDLKALMLYANEHSLAIADGLAAWGEDQLFKKVSSWYQDNKDQHLFPLLKNILICLSIENSKIRSLVKRRLTLNLGLSMAESMVGIASTSLLMDLLGHMPVLAENIFNLTMGFDQMIRKLSQVKPLPAGMDQQKLEKAFDRPVLWTYFVRDVLASTERESVVELFTKVLKNFDAWEVTLAGSATTTYKNRALPTSVSIATKLYGVGVVANHDSNIVKTTFQDERYYFRISDEFNIQLCALCKQMTENLQQPDALERLSLAHEQVVELRAFFDGFAQLQKPEIASSERFRMLWYVGDVGQGLVNEAGEQAKQKARNDIVGGIKMYLEHIVYATLNNVSGVKAGLLDIATSPRDYSVCGPGLQSKLGELVNSLYGDEMIDYIARINTNVIEAYGQMRYSNDVHDVEGLALWANQLNVPNTLTVTDAVPLNFQQDAPGILDDEETHEHSAFRIYLTQHYTTESIVPKVARAVWDKMKDTLSSIRHTDQNGTLMIPSWVDAEADMVAPKTVGRDILSPEQKSSLEIMLINSLGKALKESLITTTVNGTMIIVYGHLKMLITKKMIDDRLLETAHRGQQILLWENQNTQESFILRYSMLHEQPRLLIEDRQGEVTLMGQADGGVEIVNNYLPSLESWLQTKIRQAAGADDSIKFYTPHVHFLKDEEYRAARAEGRPIIRIDEIDMTQVMVRNIINADIPPIILTVIFEAIEGCARDKGFGAKAIETLREEMFSVPVEQRIAGKLPFFRQPTRQTPNNEDIPPQLDFV